MTVLTARMVRLEFAADGQFEDRGTMTVVNRRFPVPPIEVGGKGDALTVATGQLTLRIADTTRPFTAATTTARIGTGRGSVKWTFGERARTNLGGTRRTLDNCNGRQGRRLTGLDADGNLEFSGWERWDLDPGLLSRDGWVVVDDSATPVLGPHPEGTNSVRGRGWPEARPTGRRQDLYLLAYGTDFRSALADTAALIGPQPLPPRYAFGYWYSRFYAYTDRELLDIAEQFDTMAIPIDVMVVDMDWHLPGWTGYSWDRRYFPDPTDTLARLHRRGLRVTLNVHPADGIGPHEDRYRAVCADLGRDPEAGETVAFDATDPAFVDAYFTHLHHPEERRGVDFWWMDWQQGTVSSIQGLDPLPWLNELHWSDQEATRPDRRPLVFSRWGGLGGGRYPIGFSGDTWATWDSLALQPWFTATAANVGYGYWSHDIGGHYGPPPDPDLYARWVQFGAHSPVLRTHATKDPAQERRFWEFPDPYRRAMVEAVRRRYELAPYLYGHCRRAVETGMSAVRPMYHDHPDREDAYRADGQYMFGDSMVVAPVVEPLGQDQMATARVWLPKGEWYDTALGRRIVVRSGAGTWIEPRYLIDEVPVFVAAGALVPGQVAALRLNSACYPHLSVTAYPGADGTGELYEDDGVTTGYLRGQSVSIRLSQRTGSTSRTVRLAPARGSYPGWEPNRPLLVRFVGEAVPVAVEVDGRRLTMARSRDGFDLSSGGAAPTDYWWFDAAGTSVVVVLGRVDLERGTRVTVKRDRSLPAGSAKLLDGFTGLNRRLDAVASLLGTVSPPYPLHPDQNLAVDLAQTARRITIDPSQMAVELRRTRSNLERLAAVLGQYQAAWADAVALLFPEQRTQAAETVGQARSILETTLTQFP